MADTVADLPPLRETIATHGLDARKRFGQHFLLDLNLTRRIARAAGALGEGTTIEVGPGPGGLTRALLLEGAAKVVAIEVDPRAIDALGELRAACDGRLEVIEGDALQIAPASLGPAPRRIVANLPYNISTALLIRWLHVANDVADMVLMFQKEVVDRLAARPRTKDYGRLSVLAQHVCEVRRLFDVPPSAFVHNASKVGRFSSVAQLTPRPAADRLANLAPLERVTAAAFGQRRKMLRGALAGTFADPRSLPSSVGRASGGRPAGSLADRCTCGGARREAADFVRLAAALA